MGRDLMTTDVLICGCGPTGAMLSAYLGRAGVHNVVLEKEAHITEDPRGIALDEDGIRLVQGLGLYGHIFEDIGTYIPRLRFVSGVHNDLNKPPFMCINSSTTAGNTAHVGAITHKQPALEKCLRTRIFAEPTCELRSACTMTSIEEDEDWVYATYCDSSGDQATIRAKYLVGADGKTGFTRKKYLEKAGVQLLWAEETRYQETWVALNWKMTLPTPETHPTFPLWRFGYSPEQVYDLFFPKEFRFLCNPHRPAVCGRFGQHSDRLWRFEFVVGHDEDDAEMATPAKIEEVVVPYITHAGSRYGLVEDVRYPADCVTVLRCRPFRFSARSCDRWALGRVIVCGDAAHVFPPFGGQGIASGFRDAISLSWRLALACRSNNINMDQTLLAWYTERKQQLQASLVSTVKNGNMVNSKNPLNIFLRDWGLWVLQMIPPIRRLIELGPRLAGRMQYQHESGMPFLPDLCGGVMFSQSFCCRIVQRECDSRDILFTDDVIFSKDKKSLFQIVVLASWDSDQFADLKHTVAGLHEICTHLMPEEASYFTRHRNWPASKVSKSEPVYRIATAAEFHNSPLSDGRPYPQGYRDDDMWRGVQGKKFVIVRSDRFTFAACDTRQELELAARTLSKLFPS